jgi:hypothetical protein
MVIFDGGLAFLAFAVWLFCIIDVITTPDGETRNLPKLVWLLIVIVLVDVGSIAWLVAGHNWGGRSLVERSAAPDRARRTAATNPDDDEEFLARLRARAEEQRRRAREARPTERPDDEPPTSPA